MSKNRVALLCVALLIGAGHALEAQLERLFRTGGPALVDLSWPNEPPGFSVVTDWDMSNSIDGLYNDEPISGSGGWRIVFNSPPGSTWSGQGPPFDGTPKGWAISGTDATAPRSPSSIIDYIYPTGMLQGTGPASMYYSLTATNEVYVGIWWKPSAAPFDLGTTVNKIFFVYNGNDGIAPLMMSYDRYLVLLPEYPEYAASGKYIILYPNVTSTLITLGVWHRVELYMNVATGVSKWWLDNVLQADYTGPAHNTTPIDVIHIASTWGGCCSETKDQTDHYYFDHVYVSAP